MDIIRGTNMEKLRFLFEDNYPLQFTFDETLLRYPPMEVWDFNANRVTLTRNSGAYKSDFSVVANHLPVYEDILGKKGIRSVGPVTNLFDEVRSQSFSTASTVSLEDGTFTVKVHGGTGKLILTGGHSAEVEVGESLTFVLDSADDVTFTPADGTPEYCQLEKNPFWTPWHIGGLTRAEDNYTYTLDEDLPVSFGVGLTQLMLHDAKPTGATNGIPEHSTVLNIAENLEDFTPPNLLSVRQSGRANRIVIKTDDVSHMDAVIAQLDEFDEYLRETTTKSPVAHYYKVEPNIVRAYMIIGDQLITRKFTWAGAHFTNLKHIKIGWWRHLTIRNGNSIYSDLRVDKGSTREDVENYMGVKLFPKKPVIIFTFDDNHATDYTEVLPMFQARNIVGVSWVNTEAIGTGGKLTWSQVKEMIAAGWDVQCHTHSHPNLTTLTEEQIRAEVIAVNDGFIAQGLPIPVHHAYPHGAYNDGVMDVIKKYRKTGYGIRSDYRSNVNYIGTNPYTIRRYNADMHTEGDLNNAKTHADDVIESGGVGVYYFHAIQESDPPPGDCLKAHLESLLDYVVAKDVEILTASQYYDRYVARTEPVR